MFVLRSTTSGRVSAANESGRIPVMSSGYCSRPAMTSNPAVRLRTSVISYTRDNIFKKLIIYAPFY